MQKGCFGSVFCNDIGDHRCRTCDVYEACANVAFNKAKIIGATFHRDRLLRDHIKRGATSAGDIVATKYRIKLTDEQKKVLVDENISAKARALIRSIYGKGIDERLLLKALHDFNNPFNDKKPLPLFIGCRELIDSGFINKKKFIQILVQEGEMQRKNASSSVSCVIEALIRLEIISYDTTNYTLRVMQ